MDAESTPKKSIFQNIYVVAFFVGAIFLTIIRPFLRHVPEAPPVKGALVRFELKNQIGKTVTNDLLKGKVFVTSFIVAPCELNCETIMQRMQTLRNRFDKNRIPITSVTFLANAKEASSDSLFQFSKKYTDEYENWYFLTGNLLDIENLFQQSFAIYKIPPLSRLPHSHFDKFAIVDGNEGIRGLYNTDADGLDEIYYRAQHVLNEKSDTSKQK